ncbi:coniferyl-alcohol dehydrogenase [Sphingomonas jatrophae]|uniref:NAD(P)-dependent dehydrogenase, short-chain alcohol dehydrogenase family n=1 Tax=Sphingomonas jatrophae TaxID=1166337 RepID=A0A1I6KFC8_9SPHN|nr:coniferyl-alcohol dehydrogenase [Sphingomonas jatrophae]SFR89955.1 NAD(P)-dependent dehydrogenase, short-chain alcohol dehydrogenase family [Sphingomonas jatrophae]
MSDPWSYAGKRCIVVGCYSGIGEATARELVRLGAEVHGLDLKESPVALASFTPCDLRDTAQIDAALDGIEGHVDTLFYCAGLPQTFPAIEILQVNFLSARYLVERLRPKLRQGSAIAIIASTAGNGYPERMPLIREAIATPDYEAGLAWGRQHLDGQGDPYMFAKEIVIVWGLLQAQTLIKQGIRLNLLSPGPTISGMTKDFEAVSSAAMIDVFTAPIDRRAAAAEQAYPLIFLNSDAASYVNGLNLVADGGFTSGVMLGTIDVPALLTQVTG